MKIDIKKSLDSALSDVDWHGENEVLSRIRPKARALRLRLAFVACLLALAIGGTALAVNLGEMGIVLAVSRGRYRPKRQEQRFGLPDQQEESV